MQCADDRARKPLPYGDHRQAVCCRQQEREEKSVDVVARHGRQDAPPLRQLGGEEQDFSAQGLQVMRVSPPAAGAARGLEADVAGKPLQSPRGRIPLDVQAIADDKAVIQATVVEKQGFPQCGRHGETFQRIKAKPVVTQGRPGHEGGCSGYRAAGSQLLRLCEQQIREKAIQRALGAPSGNARGYRIPASGLYRAHISRACQPPPPKALPPLARGASPDSDPHASRRTSLYRLRREARRSWRGVWISPRNRG